MQRVAILRLRQTPDHKWPRILRAEKLDLADSVQKPLTLLFRRLLTLVLGRHFTGRHAGERLLPPFAGGGFAGVLERGQEVDSTLLSPLPVTVPAVGLDERGDALTKSPFRIGRERGEFGVLRRRRLAGQGQ